jgi:polyhydroxyalkanoate synthase
MVKEGKYINDWVRWQHAALEETFDAVGRMSHFPLLWQKAQQVRKGVTASEVVYEEDRFKLRHYVAGPPRFKTPLVFIYALVNRPYILDLKRAAV